MQLLEGHSMAGCRDGCGCWAAIIRGVVSFDAKVSLQSKSHKIRGMVCLRAAEECRFCVLSETDLCNSPKGEPMGRKGWRQFLSP